MKGILKIYHPEETLKYRISSTYCKALYSNKQHFLELEIITDDSLDHVEDDSLQYNFPQLTLRVTEYPIATDKLEGQVFEISDSAEDEYTEVDLHCNEDAYLSDCKLTFQQDESGELELFWEGLIDDFYTDEAEGIPFKLKCNFRQDEILIDED